MTLVHLVPEFVERRYAAGHWKAVQAIDQLVADLSVPCHRTVFCPESPATVVAEIDPGTGGVILEYTWWPALQAELRRRLPACRLYVRAVNAEALQHGHRSGLAWVPTFGNTRTLYGCMRLALRDWSARRHSDGVLGISAWDNRHYWARLPARPPVFDVPYCSPWPALRPSVRPVAWPDREDVVLCLAGERDAIGRSSVSGLCALFRHVAGSGEFNSWTFAATPGLGMGVAADGVPDGVERRTGIDQPWDTLCASKAVAVLTPLGFGTKTTIVDALAAGCHVLVHPRLAQRLPCVVRDRCLVVDPESPPPVADLARMLEEVPAEQDVNEAQRAIARQALARCMGISSPGADR